MSIFELNSVSEKLKTAQRFIKDYNDGAFWVQQADDIFVISPNIENLWGKICFKLSRKVFVIKNVWKHLIVYCEYNFDQSTSYFYVNRERRHTGSKSHGRLIKTTSVRIHSVNGRRILIGECFACALNASSASFENENSGFDKEEAALSELLANNWLEWWNDRKTHFANAFKPVGAAPVNLSEVYHSSNATTGSKGLKLIDAAYKDVVIALRAERFLELFGKGNKCQGSGPSGTKRRKRDFTAQSQRAKEYAEVILDDELSNNNAQSPMDSSKVNQRGEISASSSENDTDVSEKESGQVGKISVKKDTISNMLYICATFWLSFARNLSFTWP
ncbi:Hypothetical predicted protein [Paramuricea clavata]|uniref:Uncharacterized protein n=1 Tax=Paramuricea clavata TaxID=317549 RepID=A0A7D9IBF5_PARCT|nr:Hypothetical predicted protein [Paramuricea clavata]